MDVSPLLPALEDILRDAEAVRALYELPSSGAYQATVLLRRCLDALPIESPESLATQAILRNLQPIDTPPSRHRILSESQEFDRLYDEIGYSLEPAQRLPLSRQPSTAQSIESSVADPTLPSISRTDTLPSIDEELSHPSIPPVSPRLPAFSWEESLFMPESRSLLSLSRCECLEHSSTGQHRPWCSQIPSPYPQLVTTPPIPRPEPRTSLPSTISSPLSRSSLASTSRPLPPVPIPGRPPISHRYTPHDLPQMIVDSPTSTTTATPTNILSPPLDSAPTPATSVRPLEADQLDAAIRALIPTIPTRERAITEQDQPLLLPSPINSPPDDDSDPESRGLSPLVATPPLDFLTCRARLQTLIEEEEQFIQDNWDAIFATSLRNANPRLVPLGLVDDLISSTFTAFLQIRAAHSLALAAIKPLTGNFDNLDSLETLFILTGDIIARFSSLYPEYAQGLKDVHTTIEDAMEAHHSFKAWMEVRCNSLLLWI
jgi:hypothetical protein